MRELTQLPNERLAQRLSDTLLGQGIDNEVQPLEGAYRVWVYSEAHMEDARRALADFRAAPDAAHIERLVETGRARRKQTEASVRKPARHEEVDVRTRWSRSERRYGQLTLGLIAISVLVYILTGQGERVEVLRYLYIGTPADVMTGSPLASVLQGEVWRLITPIFVHGGMLHILFNMWWLLDLGSMIERRQGTLFLGALVLVSGVLSNLAQYLIGGSFLFGGMSGVVYALLGYIWLRGRFDPASQYFLPTHIVTFMLVWLMLGVVELIPNVANLAHAGGLVVGGAWGYFLSGDIGRRLRR